MLSKEDRYIIGVVHEDLVFLREKWDQEVSDESLRRSSNVLRNLLVEDQYGRAWRALGLDRQPQISAPDMDNYFDGFDISQIVLAQAGGAIYRGMQIAALCSGRYVLSPEQRMKRVQKGPYALENKFYLREYLESPCMIVKGVKIARRQLIKYIANKLGGIHIDFRRDNASPEDRQYILLDSIPDNIEVAGKKPLYYELLSIGQCVAKADDTEKFISIVKEI
jgi:hypothetical protein